MVVTALAAITVGIHLGTAHFSEPKEGAPQSGRNPGLYLVADTEALGRVGAGIFRNSIGRTSAYAQKIVSVGPFDLGIGVAYGYQKKTYYGEQYCPSEYRKYADYVWGGFPEIHRQLTSQCYMESGWSRGALSPLIGLSYAPKGWPLTPRITLLPAGVHLSVEKSFD